MPSLIPLSWKNRLRYWAFLIITALGVGGYQAAQLLGCESGWIDDAPTVPADPSKPDGPRVPNPNLGACVEP